MWARPKGQFLYGAVLEALTKGLYPDKRHVLRELVLGITRLGEGFNRRRALRINPPVYDTEYWAERSQPNGLSRIAALLKNAG